MRGPRSAIVTLLAVLVCSPAAAAGPGMLVGAREDALKWKTAETIVVARDLGLRALGITLGWQPGQTDLSPQDASMLNSIVVGAGSMRVVVAVFARDEAPVVAANRDQYCAYVGRLITRFPQINDVVIWNEPNLNFFWRPQYALGVSEAPARYQELLARCWDVLHGVRPTVNVVAPATSVWGNDNPNAFSNVSHSPGSFIRGMGAAFRASGRTRPLFDTFGHHPYPARSDERPWTTHGDEAILSVGDIDRLLGVLREAFGGTAQPLPENGVPIWYLETGYQTEIDESKRGLYTGFENWPGSLPDVASPPGAPARPPDTTPAPDQATQLADSIRLTSCHPYIGAVFNFLLQDEPDLEGWQSGVLWADGSRKDSYEPFRDVVREVNEGRVDCTGSGFATGGSASGQTGTPGQPPTSAKKPVRARALTKLTYQGRRQVAYGSLRLRAQLTRGVSKSKRGLSAKQLLFLVGRAAYLTTTDASGSSSVMPIPPVNPGKYRVAVRFGGDELNLGSGLRVGVRVVNSKARIESVGSLRLGARITGRLSVRSNGSTVRGTLRLRERGTTRMVRLRALGLRDNGRVAWMGGSAGTNRYILQLERLRGRPSVRVRLWRNGSPAGRVSTVPASRLHISRL